MQNIFFLTLLINFAMEINELIGIVVDLAIKFTLK